ncbi:MAG: hypothetical protein ACE5DW_02675 [Thermodesulfobacteriota bacterium]
MRTENRGFISRRSLDGFILLFFFFFLISLPLAASAAGPETTRAFSGPAVPMVPAKLAKVTMAPQRGVDVPLGYAIDRQRLKALKNAPYVTPKGGIQPTLREDPAVKAKAPAPLAPGLIKNFEGIDDGGQPDGFLHRPPDPTMAAGINHVVTVVNSTIDIYNKAGGLVIESSLAAWFASVAPPGGPFDPKVVYDAAAGHWMIIALASDSSSKAVFLLSVSQTANPTGAWWNYKINSVTAFGGSAWGDYEDIGFDNKTPGSVFISSNQFSFSSGFFTTAQLVTLSKSELYTGGPLTLFKTVGLQNSDGSLAFSIRPARTQGASTGEFMINSRSGGGTGLTLWKVTHAFPAAPVVSRQATVNIGGYTPAPNARQLGCANLLDTIDNRIYNAVYKNNKLYAGFTEGHNWGSGTVAAIRLLEIDTVSNTAVVNETYGSDGLYYWFPAVTVDGSGNIISVFARSGVTEYAGVRYSGRLTTDPAMQASLPLKAGETCITGSRWGDYFGISVDPTDNANVWIYGEWAKDVAGVTPVWDWGTWIGEVSFSVAPPPPAVTLTLTPDTSTVARGGTLGYQISATNTTTSRQCLDYWENVTLPSSVTYPVSGELFGPVHICLNAGATKSVHMTKSVPMSAPVGAYLYNGYVGPYSLVDNSDMFNLNITALSPAVKKPAASWRLLENGFRE